MLAAASVVLVAWTTAIALSRPPGDAPDNMWADDGVPFFTEVHALGARSLVTPYTGYLHLYPRLTAFVSLLFPIRDAAAVFSTAGALTTAAAAATLFLAGQDLVRDTALRFVAALAVPLLPTAGADPEGNVANAHWWLNLTAALLAFRPDRGPGPARRIGNALAGVALVVAAGSDPTVLVVAPVVLWRYAQARRRRDTRQCRVELLDLGLLLVVCAVQFAVAATHDRDASPERPTPALLAAFYARTVVVPLVAGLRPGGPRPALAVAAVVVCLLALGTGLVQDHRRGWRAAALTGVGVLLFLPPPILKWNAPMFGLTAAGMPFRARYTVSAATLLFVALVAAVDIVRATLPVGRPVARAAVVLAVAAVVAGLYLPAFSAGRLREPSWSAQVTTARAACRGAAGTHRVLLQGAPDLPVWRASITCSQLSAHP